MKTMLKVTLAIAIAAFANTLFAAGNLNVNIQPLSEEKAAVLISSLTDSNLKITVEDSKGKIFYYIETTDAAGNYHKVYDFSYLDEGQYKLIVVSDNLTTERPFQKTYRGIKVGEEKTNMKPFFVYEDGILRCSYLNFTKGDVTLDFFKKNQLVYSKKVGRKFNVCEAFNLSKLSRGSYEAVLSSADNVYSYPIQIK